ncbi:MAG: HlyD family efflux transporter periplasmic adaptor subunit [Bacteroidales bacterium]
MLNQNEIRNPEMQEVMSGIPGGFLRWGSFLFFSIILIILGLSWLFNFPTVVKAPLTITTFNSPAPLTARSGGKIEKLIAKNEEYVEYKEAVAVIANTSRFGDVLSLESFTDALQRFPDWHERAASYDAPDGLALGEIQMSYSGFSGLFKQYKEYLAQAYIPAKLNLLKEQIKKQDEYSAEMLNQVMLSEKDLMLVTNSFERDSLLYFSQLHPVSLSEYEKSKQTLIQKQSSHSSLKAAIKNNEIASMRLKETRLDLQVQLENDLNRFSMDLDEAFQTLNIAFGQWKEKYLIESPVNGRITFTRFWSENQVIREGEILATVIPEDSVRIIVRAKVPISGIGRVKAGQEVNIKLSGFPYMEFGVIKGRISSLSLVPEAEEYIAEIHLSDGMKSTYNINLDFINEMTGTADIITEKRRLIFRLIKPLRALKPSL